VIGGDVPLNVYFALSDSSVGAAALLISAFKKFDEYSICIAIITMEYEITISLTELTEVFGCITGSRMNLYKN